MTDSAESVSFLLSRGADSTARDVDGRTPLMMYCQDNNATCVERILKEPSALAMINARDRYRGKTALHLAAWGAGGDPRMLDY